jgi:hypothetical protein
MLRCVVLPALFVVSLCICRYLATYTVSSCDCAVWFSFGKGAWDHAALQILGCRWECLLYCLFDFGLSKLGRTRFRLPWLRIPERAVICYVATVPALVVEFALLSLNTSCIYIVVSAFEEVSKSWTLRVQKNFKNYHVGPCQLWHTSPGTVMGDE